MFMYVCMYLCIFLFCLFIDLKAAFHSTLPRTCLASPLDRFLCKDKDRLLLRQLVLHADIFVIQNCLLGVCFSLY